MKHVKETQWNIKTQCSLTIVFTNESISGYKRKLTSKEYDTNEKTT